MIAPAADVYFPKKLVDHGYQTLVDLGPVAFELSKHSLVLIQVVLITIALVSLVGYWYRRTDSNVPRGPLMNAVEKFVIYVRDVMVYPVMGEKHGRKFLPFFLTLFSFLLVANLLGNVPEISIPWTGVTLYPSATVTAEPFVTGSLALLVLVVGMVYGIWKMGFMGYLGHFVPHGVPKAIGVIIWPIEIFGTLLKHIILAVRLNANMLAGHAVLYALLEVGIIILNQLEPTASGIVVASAATVVPLSIGLFLYAIELLIAVLHAYIFTILSVIFIDLQISAH